jgi:hypothetical protein
MMGGSLLVIADPGQELLKLGEFRQAQEAFQCRIKMLVLARIARGIHEQPFVLDVRTDNLAHGPAG